MAVPSWKQKPTKIKFLNNIIDIDTFLTRRLVNLPKKYTSVYDVRLHNMLYEAYVTLSDTNKIDIRPKNNPKYSAFEKRVEGFNHGISQIEYVACIFYGLMYALEIGGFNRTKIDSIAREFDDMIYKEIDMINKTIEDTKKRLCEYKKMRKSKNKIQTQNTKTNETSK